MAAAVATLGAAVLVGWSFGIAFLKVVIPNTKEMAPSTAVCFLVAGLALWTAVDTYVPGLDWRSRRPIAYWLSCGGAGFLAIVGVFKLVEYAAAASLGIDTLLFSRAPDATQMAPATALSFVFTGGALLLGRTRFLRAFQWLSLASGLLSWVALSQRAYGGDPLVPLDAMAVHTAGGFLILCIGILCLRPDTGLTALLTSTGPGGVVSRRLVPAAVLVPGVIGWLRIAGQRAGWYGTEAGVALFAVADIAVFGALVWMNAALLETGETARKRAERRIHAQLERLGLLQQITRAISDRQDMQSIFQAVLSRLEDHLPLDFCCICRYEAAAQEVIVAATGPRSQDFAVRGELTQGARVAIDQNGLSRCVAGQLVYEPDVSQVQFPFPQRIAGVGLRALVAAPLQAENQVFGLLVAARRQAESFSSGECEFMLQLSEHVALASHQAELHTALQQAYDDLRTTQDAVMQQERLRALGQMASGIAHDINNAVSPVALYTDILLEQEQNMSPRTRHYLEITQRAIGDVVHTIGRMGEFYRQREPLLPLEPADLNHMLQQVVDLTRARWSDMPQQRGITIEIRQDLTPGLPPIAAIESEIREALTNLIFNAVDAMPEGGTLSLRTTLAPPAIGAATRRVSVEVTDSGTGMSEETRRRCLEPFFTTKGERGTGLGLAMVHGIVRRHNADLEIDSRPGKGTTMRIAFSVAAASLPASAPIAEAVPSPRRILVVDDDPMLIKSLGDALADDGHTVVTANGGQEGIDAFRTANGSEGEFAAVITDLGMPYVDGRKVAAAVKAASPATPVIMLTGWGQRLNAEGSVPPYVDCVLNKPPKLRELREALIRAGQG